MAAPVSNIVEMLSKLSGEDPLFLNFIKELQRREDMKQHMKQHMETCCSALADLYCQMYTVEDFTIRLVQKAADKQNILFTSSPEAEERRKLDEILEKIKRVEYMLQEVVIKLNSDVSPPIESSLNIIKKLVTQKSDTNTGK